jgi:hypothetical protein
MKLTTYIRIMLSSIVLYACSQEIQVNPSGDQLEAGQMIIKVNPGKNNEVRFRANAEQMTIDWGDGHVDDYDGIQPGYTRIFM